MRCTEVNLLRPSVGQASGSEEDSYFEGVTGTEHDRKTGCEMNKSTVNVSCNETISEMGCIRPQM